MQWSVALLLVAVAGGLALASWMLARSDQPVEVKGIAVSRGPISAFVRATGFVDAQQNFTISAPHAAHLLKLHHEVGQTVQRGETLAVLDSGLSAEQLRNTEARLGAQEAQVRQAELEVEAEVAVWRAGGQARNAVDQAESRLAAARALREAARSDVRAAGLKLAALAVTAPADGVVTAVSAHPGEFLQAGAPLLSLASHGSLEVRIKVDHGSADQIEPGQTVELATEGAPDRVGSTRIVRIEPKLQPDGSRNQLIVIAAMPASGFAARLNQQLTARILTVSKPQSLLVPLDAVTEKDGADVVRVVTEGRLRLQSVRTGIQDGKQIEILDGLTQGQQVVLPNARQVLAEGTPVRFTGSVQP